MDFRLMCNKYVLLLVLAIQFHSLSASELSVRHLLCEHMVNPLGVDIPIPGLSWKIYSEDTQVLQTAYRIIVSENIEQLRNDVGVYWDSEKVISDNSIQVFYEGVPLKPAKTYYWKVKVWDNRGRESEWSEISLWKMGLVSSADWGKAKWITFQDSLKEQRLVPGIHSPGSDELGDMRNVLPYFRKEFEIKKKLKSATAYVSGLGHFEMSLNGRKVGNHFLDPGWTNYDKYALYLAFDVLPYLSEGDNACGIMLGNGFYHTPRERYRKCTIS